ncbi:MAG: class I SAM-dependent methyltransferase [Alphaproteobacteria bacterium]
MARRSINLTDPLHEYLVASSVREPAVLARLRAETAPLEMAGMQISAEQGQFMRLLVELIGAKRVVEVGTFTGYSSLAVALSLPADGRIVACDVNREWTGIARRYWAEAGVAGKIDLRLAPARDTLDAMIAAGEQGRYDFAFIDADKKNYDAYYERCLQLVRGGGLLAIDNVLWNGKVIDSSANDEDTNAIRALNAKIAKDERVSVSLVPIGDGLTLARKR